MRKTILSLLKYLVETILPIAISVIALMQSSRSSSEDSKRETFNMDASFNASAEYDDEGRIKAVHIMNNGGQIKNPNATIRPYLIVEVNPAMDLDDSRRKDNGFPEMIIPVTDPLGLLVDIITISTSTGELWKIDFKSNPLELWQSFSNFNESGDARTIPPLEISVLNNTSYVIEVANVSLGFFIDVTYESNYSGVDGNILWQCVPGIEIPLNAESNKTSRNLRELDKSGENDESAYGIYQMIRFASNLVPCTVTSVSDSILISDVLQENARIYYDDNYGVFVSSYACYANEIDSYNSLDLDTWHDEISVKNGDEILIEVHTKNIYGIRKHVILHNLLPPGTSLIPIDKRTNATLIRRSKSYTNNQWMDWSYSGVFDNEGKDNGSYEAGEDTYYRFAVKIEDEESFCLSEINISSQLQHFPVF